MNRNLKKEFVEFLIIVFLCFAPFLALLIPFLFSEKIPLSKLNSSLPFVFYNGEWYNSKQSLFEAIEKAQKIKIIGMTHLPF